MIYVVKYNGLFQHREETWFPDKPSAERHIMETALALQDPSVCDRLTIEERHGLTYATGNGLKTVNI